MYEVFNADTVSVQSFIMYPKCSYVPTAHLHGNAKAEVITILTGCFTKM